MIDVTDKAKFRIVELLKARNKGVGIQIGVKTTGCSGLAYVLEYIDEIPKDPGKTYVFDQFCVYISDKNLPYIGEFKIDYVKQGLNEGFEFTNSSEKDRCGCGESFRI